MGGVSSLFFLRQLAEAVEHAWPAVLAKLEDIRRILINRNAMLCNVTLDQENWAQFQPKLTGLIEAFPSALEPIRSWSPQPLPACEGLTIPARVNYVSKGANLYKLGYRFHGSISVILNYLRTTWLWERVRVQGGAYGRILRFRPFFRRLQLSFLSRSEFVETLATYDQASQFLQQADLSDAELTKSIIGVIGQMDDYQLPDAKGYTSLIRYLSGVTEEERQQIRDEVLATRPEDFKAFADILRQVNTNGLVVVMGSQEAIDQANADRGGWLQTLKVL